jgi:hypothetical protein
MKKLLNKINLLRKKEEKISENIFCITKKEIPFWIPGRRMGNTTRLIDSYVQDFFIKGMCITKDHHNTRKSDLRIFDLVLKRLEGEHNIKRENLKLSRNRLTIENPDFR